MIVLGICFVKITPFQELERFRDPQDLGKGSLLQAEVNNMGETGNKCRGQDLQGICQDLVMSCRLTVELDPLNFLSTDILDGQLGDFLPFEKVPSVIQRIFVSWRNRLFDPLHLLDEEVVHLLTHSTATARKFPVDHKRDWRAVLLPAYLLTSCFIETL